MIELSQLAKILKDNLKLILIATLVGGLVGLSVSLWLGTRYEATNTLYVKREAEKPSANYYNYDGFYSQQTSKEYTDTVLGLLKTIEPYREAAEKLNNTIDPKELFGSTKARKTSPQVVSLSIVRQSESEARKALTTLIEGLVEKVKVLNQNGDGKLFVEPIRAEPFVSVLKPSLTTNSALGLLSGLLTALVFLALKNYLRS